MILLTNEKIITTVLEKLKITYTRQEQIVVNNYAFAFSEKGHFYITEQENAQTEAVWVEMSAEEAWKLNKFQNNIQYYRFPVQIIEGQLEKINYDDVNADDDLVQFAYFKRTSKDVTSMFCSLDEIDVCVNQKRQLEMCDIYLMIPGKFKKRGTKTPQDCWNDLPEVENDLFSIYKMDIDETIDAEYNNEFIKRLERKCLGPVILELANDPVEGRTFYQTGLIEIVKHETGLCIMEIMVHNCYVGGNKLLNYYCADMLKLIYNGQKYTVNSFLESLSIKRYGDKRSMIFAYGDLEKKEIINALANEEYPMGQIGGSFEKKVESDNHALYDTAKVYVSTASMIEWCQNLTNDVSFLTENRIAYHVIEIFFVELLLFHDAAVDKVYVDLMKEQEEQYKYGFSEEDMEIFEEISFDMSKAVKFGDYRQFNFPTVRESAKRIAKSFGINHIFEKYNQNKDLLESMMSANKRRIEEKENRIKNRFLLIISFVATAEALGQILYGVYTDNVGGGIAYAGAVALIIIGYLIYLFVILCYKKITKKKKS